MLDDGIRNTNFVNGRLLVAEDLQTFQKANLDQHGLLGRAIGDGVVNGLYASLIADGSVSSAAPVVQLTMGLAINRRGRALVLPDQVQVQLALSSTTAAPDPGKFSDCGLGSTTTFVPGQIGASILCISPAAGFAEQAPLRSLDNCGCTTGCGSKYAVEGVKFSLVPLPPPPNDFPTDTPNLQRNYLAYYCLGTPTLDTTTDPLHVKTQYGAIDTLRASGALTDCDVPLALVYWTQSGVQFVDNWSVRRRAFPRLGDGVDNPWPMHAGQRRLAEAEAMFQQFQDQLADIYASQADVTGVVASDYFRYLPAGGFVPLGSRQLPFLNQILDDFPGWRRPIDPPAPMKGFVEGTFFTGLVTDDENLDVAFMRWYIEKSWYLDPIDLKARTLPPIRIYKTGLVPRWLLFLREEIRPVAPPKPGRIVVTLTFTLSFEQVREFKIAQALSLFETAEIFAELSISNLTTQYFKGAFENVSIATSVLAGSDSPIAVYTPTYLIDALPPGSYAVGVNVKGWNTSNPNPVQVQIAAGETKQVPFVMTPPQ
jgi:hypothetical protein